MTNNKELITIAHELSTASALTTYLRNVIVASPVKITLDYGTPISINNATIVVWKGLSIPYDNLSSYIYSAHLPAGNGGSFNIIKEDISFSQGGYTVGLCFGTDITSVSAAVSILNGQVFNYQETSLYLVSAAKTSTSIVLTVAYTTPNGNNPKSHNDWIELFNGSTQKVGGGAYKNFPIYSSNSSDMIQLTLSLGDLKYQQPYILEYNPGYFSANISATYSFVFNQ